LLDAALAGSSGDRVDNRARSGATTYAALPAAQDRPAGRPATQPTQDVALALETNPRVLVLAFPSNDALLGFTPAETVANLLVMRDAGRSRGVAVVMLSSQPRDDASASANSAMQASDTALVAEFGACFVTVRDVLADPPGRIAPRYAFGDGVHLNDAGHRLVFERVWAAVRSGGGCVIPR
jgi:acyl-CoA thioesterase I